LRKVWWGAFLFLAPSLIGIIAGVVMICVAIGGSANPVSEPARVALTAGGVGTIAVCAVLAWSYLSASYEVTSDELVVRFGPIRLRYQLCSVTDESKRRSRHDVRSPFWAANFSRHANGSQSVEGAVARLGDQKSAW
jgi:hypothetical protein